MARKPPQLGYVVSDFSFLLNEPTLGPAGAKLHKVLNEIVAQINSGFQVAGVNPYRSGQGPIGQSVSPPPQATFKVSGVSGLFVVAITNPANLTPGTVLIHELASCLTMNFDAAGSVQVYGPDPSLSRTYAIDTNPRFWRLRSKLANSDFNNPIYTTQAVTP